jgi:hypothetical protein
MFLTSSWFPSRIPASLVLLPIFWFVLAISPNLNQWRALWVLIIVHVLLYTSVNGFNNYFSKKSIEVNYKNTTKYSGLLLIVSILLVVVAITLACLKVSLLFATLVAIYAFAGATYSYPLVQWKQYRGVAWVLNGIIQGIFTLVILYIGINQFSLENIYQLKILFPGLLITLVLWAFTPLLSGKALQTKEVETRRKVFSLRDNPIFFLVIELFTLSIVLAGLYFKVYISGVYFPPLLLFYLAGLILIYLYFFPTKVNYTALLSWIVILSLNVFSFYLFTDYTHIFQLI